MADTETRKALPHQVPIEETLDLHMFAPSDIRSVVREYLKEAQAAGFVEIRLIHGRGIGVQRGIVQSVLDRNSSVRSFHDAPESHLGATVVILYPSGTE
jgi:dsDNA-specific endonuclease/ATPase MutS2|tara:strand:+ start:105 stop:401 length:297 start_codon:yes stop_codon:yes gene_type:complete